MQAFGRVIRQDPHFTLSDDLTVVDFFIHVVHCATTYRFARRERLFPRFESWKFGQKRWMDIDDTSWKRFEHRCMEHAHEASQHDEVNTSLAQHFYELVFHFRL
jgi:hypothetical protein